MANTEDSKSSGESLSGSSPESPICKCGHKKFHHYAISILKEFNPQEPEICQYGFCECKGFE